jgi:hypothetical protein
VTPPLAMDRRDVLKLGGTATLALLAPTGIDMEAAVPVRSAASIIALADPRYDYSMRFAESLRRQGAKPLILASDRARVWFDGVRPKLRTGLHYLIGLTLESDLFVLERLAGSSGARTDYVGLHDWRCRQGSAHTLSGSINLDPIATALLAGKTRWAESLGRALALANEGGRTERRLDLDCAIPAGPRFFVSWRMGWTA